MATGSTKTFGRFSLTRPPRDDDELYSLVQALWGVTIPRGKVCKHHQSPFQWFADSFFARDPMTLVHGSRGLSGKSFAMAALGLTNAVVWGADVNLLGGSLAQSTNLHEHMRNSWDYEGAPSYMVKDESNIKILLTNHARIRPLTASQRTVRGPHPARLLLDEIDEMDYSILQAALGQPMRQRNWMGVSIPAHTAMASTWQNADGCVLENTLVLTRQGAKKIQAIRPGLDQVPTRTGWATVSHKVYVGQAPTITITGDYGTLTCTPIHPVWTQRGWVRAQDLRLGDALLHAGPIGPVAQPVTRPAPPTPGGVDHDRLFGIGQVMALGAQRRDDPTGDNPHGLPVAGIHTLSVPTQRDQPGLGLGTQEGLVDPAVGGNSHPSDLLLGMSPTDGPRPGDTVLGVQIQDAAVDLDHVRSITHSSILRPVWDLQVDPTHEYVAGGYLVHNTFAAEYKRFNESGLPIYTWCYKDSANPYDGWLLPEDIEQKRREIPAEMWRVEYELGEPSIGNRAFDSEAVERMFDTDPPQPVKKTRDYEEYLVETYKISDDYVIAADWAKSQDHTVISVWKVSDLPIRLVYYVRLNRRPYPLMVGIYNKLAKEYHATAIHDATGLGSVVADLIDGEAWDFLMVGRPRADMLTEYVAAVENDRVRAPRIPSLYNATKYARVEDLYSQGQDYHLPDEVCSSALAWRVVSGRFPAVAPVGIPKQDSNWMAAQFEKNTDHYLSASPVRIDGEVSSQEEPAWLMT